VTDLLDRLHIDAGLDLLRADAGLTVYPNAEGFIPPSVTLPYVRVYATIERPPDADGNSLAGLSQRWLVRWYCHCVGVNEYSALAIQMRVRAALLDQQPTIAGRICGRIREDQALPPNRDETTGSAVFDAIVIYRLMTT